MTENERLKTLVKSSRFPSQKDFAAFIGMQSGSLSDVLRSKDGLGVSRMLKEKLHRKLNVNINWLEKGEGLPYLSGYAEDERGGGVPLYPSDYNVSGSGQNFLEGVPEFFVNFRPFNDCTAYLSVFGDSMYPKYASGEIIAIKEVQNPLVLLWGESYVVVTGPGANDLKMIKNVFEHQDAAKLTLRSSNPNFKGETVILREHIHKLYLIKGKITRYNI